MSISLIMRLVFMFVIAFVGWEFGAAASVWMAARFPITLRVYQIVFTLIGALAGFLTAPYITVWPYRLLRERVCKVSARALIMGIVGGAVGLFLSALLALPLSMLPGAWGQILPIVCAVLLAFVCALILVMRDRDILNILGLMVGRDSVRRKRNVVLLDTSVIIDGRIADIRQTGFISGAMIVPRFVLNELQHIADSADVLRRNRGRRGLDILNSMQKDDSVPLEISEMDADGIDEVDSKLVKLAQDLDCPVLTNDYNLNRVAELQGVRVLNINELANAVKVVVLPGESLDVHIIQQGKEPGQGVGYLDDGTMVVVEEGRRCIDSTISVAVTRVLQTVAGRMIFGQVREARR